MMVIVMAGHGHLSGLWRLRLWFVYTVLCLAFRDLVDNVVSRYVPIKSPLHALSPKATKLGFLAGGAAAFFFYYQFATLMTNTWWFDVQPIKLSLQPFDPNAVLIDTSDNQFQSRPMFWNLGPVG